METRVFLRRVRKALTGGLAASAALMLLAGAGMAAGHVSVAAKKAAILTYLKSLPAQHKTLSGVQVDEFEVYLPCNSSDRIRLGAGHAPAIMGLELMGAIAFPPYKDYLIDRAEEQAEAGGLVTMSWHERNPSRLCVRGEFFDCTQSKMTADELAEVLKPGTEAHARWIADVDAIAGIFHTLSKRGVVVLFRPYHEMNGGWFWWGQKALYPKLWDALYAELVERQHVDNLIWVWSGDREVPDAAKYVPVQHEPDVAGIDVYEKDSDSPKYPAGRANVMAAFHHDPLFAITEVGHLPSAAMLDKLNPVWMLLWGEAYVDKRLEMKADTCPDCNDFTSVVQMMHNPRMVTRRGLPKPLRILLSDGVKRDHPTRPAKAVCQVP